MTPLTDVGDIADTVARNGGELRSGGTDVVARHRAGLTTGPFVDLRGVAELRGISWRSDGSARVGATTTIAEVAGDDRLRASYPALTLTAEALATPQIRATGTIGGNLLQRNRCWYYRNPHFSCHQDGGTQCPARSGPGLYASVIDTSPCVAPHPSSIAMALIAYEANVAVHGRGVMSVRDLYGDGSDPTRDHLLNEGEVLLAIELPAPESGERAAYHRAISRSQAEWPLVEAVARVGLADTTITFAAVAGGGVARTPVRLTEVENALVGRDATPQTMRAAAEHATARCTPPPQTRYKVGLLRDTVLEVLERAALPDGTV
jgi:xanthine dehydrogenase YagS FAD-binding subunit